jgi:Protein HRI1
METTTVIPCGKPSASARVSISWPPAPPIEDSSVLVLSSCPYKYTPDPNALHFLLYLDLRLSLPLSPSSQITWGFGGIRHTLQVNPHSKFRWDHIVDSRKGKEGCDTVDEGETIVSRDAITGEDVEVETGIGWNPDAGRVQRYKEVWR